MIECMGACWCSCEGVAVRVGLGGGWHSVITTSNRTVQRRTSNRGLIITVGPGVDWSAEVRVPVGVEAGN